MVECGFTFPQSAQSAHYNDDEFLQASQAKQANNGNALHAGQANMY